MRDGVTDPRFDEPSEGLPPWLLGPVQGWVHGSFNVLVGTQGRRRRSVQGHLLTALQLGLRLEEPLTEGTDEGRLLDLEARLGSDNGNFGLDVVDWMLHNSGRFHFQKTSAKHWAAKLDRILSDGGSAWETSTTEEAFQLTRRAVGPVSDVLTHTATEATRAHAHLGDAWSKLMGRNPDPTGAYREAIRAVEAVAKPVVLPNDSLASLGKMIGTFKTEPQNWSTTLGSIVDVRAQMEAVHKGQLDRHGTDDESIPLNVSQEEADAAFSVCLDLVRQFAGGHIRRATS